MRLLKAKDKHIISPQQATFEELMKYHSKAYLEAMQRADGGEYDMGMLAMNLGSGRLSGVRGDGGVCHLGSRGDDNGGTTDIAWKRKSARSTPQVDIIMLS